MNIKDYKEKNNTKGEDLEQNINLDKAFDLYAGRLRCNDELQEMKYIEKYNSLDK